MNHSTATAVSIRNLGKSFDGVPVLEGISFDIAAGEQITLMGPNGAGKTTLLRILAGLDTPTTGRIEYPNGVRPRLGYVFQDGRSSLLPWRSVRDNIVFPLKLRGWDRPRIDRALQAMVDRVGFSLNLSSRVWHLSGGEAQKCVIVRALLTEPELLLCDEPLNALDLEAQSDVRAFLARGLNSLVPRPTVVYVQHNIDDAILLSDRVVMLPRDHRSPPVDYAVPAPWPRDESLVFSPDVARHRAALWEAFRRACR